MQLGAKYQNTHTEMGVKSEGNVHTLLRTVQNPLNCRVAPKRESMRLPHSPARAERGITNTCFKATSCAHFVVKNPTTTKVSPMTLPAAAAANSPAIVTPPFVPLRTG